MGSFNLDNDGTSSEPPVSVASNDTGGNTGPGKDNGIGTETSGSDNGINDAETIAPKPAAKRRGRPRKPRDADGTIISDAPGTANAGNKERVDLGGFRQNNRGAIRQQIQGIHAAVAVLTKQPVLVLTNDEAIALTSSLCDVLDFHRINITEAGGHYGLYVTLIVTVFGVYNPRLKALKPIKQAKKTPESPAAPATPNAAMGNVTKMNFAGA